MDDILYYGQYGKCMYKPKLCWHDNFTCQDLIIYNEGNHHAELAKYLSFDKSVDMETQSAITSIVKEFWFFYHRGCKAHYLGIRVRYRYRWFKASLPQKA